MVYPPIEGIERGDVSCRMGIWLDPASWVALKVRPAYDVQRVYGSSDSAGTLDTRERAALALLQ